MRYTKIALSVAMFAAALSAQAADIQIYGRVDSGLMFTDAEGVQSKTELISGGRSASRLGFNIVEDLGNGYKVKAYLENGFKLDSGEFSTEGSLFDRRSILAVQGPWAKSVVAALVRCSPRPHRTPWVRLSGTFLVRPISRLPLARLLPTLAVSITASTT